MLKVQFPRHCVIHGFAFRPLRDHGTGQRSRFLKSDLVGRQAGRLRCRIKMFVLLFCRGTRFPRKSFKSWAILDIIFSNQLIKRSCSAFWGIESFHSENSIAKH